MAASSRFGADSGYWVAFGCGAAILTSGTAIAPLTFGILVVALIYQTNLLIGGK